MWKKILILCALAVALFISFKYFPYSCDCSYQTPIKIGEVELKVEVVDTFDERAIGLSGKEGLKEGQGMLFMFETPGNYGFWMKNMNFDIDIIWINDEKVVIGVSEGVKKESYPQVFRPPGEAKYVLEVPAGFAERELIVSGQILSIEQ